MRVQRVGLVLSVLVGLGLVATGVPTYAADPVATVTTVTLAPASPRVGATAVATVTVTGAAPTGAVTLTAGDLAYGAGNLNAGTVSFDAGPFTGPTTLVATYAGDAANAPSTGTLQVVPAPAESAPKVTLTASASKVSVGDRVRLRWRSKGADRLKAAGAWKGSRGAHGSVMVRVTTRGKNVFRLTARNDAGTARARVVVTAARKAKTLAINATDALVMPGDKVAVTAGGLAAGEPWTLRLAGKVVATGTASAKGSVATGVVVPKPKGDGALALTITGSNPGRMGATELEVIVAKQLAVEVESDSLPTGGSQTVSVTGLVAGEPVTVRYQGRTLATGKADADGKLDYTFTVGEEKGQQTVTVTGADASRTGAATFKVTGKKKQDPPPSEL